MIELFKIIHNTNDIRVTAVLEFSNRGLTSGNKYKNSSGDEIANVNFCRTTTYM